MLNVYPVVGYWTPIYFLFPKLDPHAPGIDSSSTACSGSKVVQSTAGFFRWRSASIATKYAIEGADVFFGMCGTHDAERHSANEDGAQG